MGKRNSGDLKSNEKAPEKCCYKSPFLSNNEKKCSVQPPGVTADKWTCSSKPGQPYGASGSGRNGDQCGINKAVSPRTRQRSVQVNSRADANEGCDIAGYGNVRRSTDSGQSQDKAEKAQRPGPGYGHQDATQQVFAPRKNKGVGDATVRDDVCEAPRKVSDTKNPKYGVMEQLRKGSDEPVVTEQEFSTTSSAKEPPKSKEPEGTSTHMRCCAKGEEGRKDCVVCKPFVAGKTPLSIKYKAVLVDAKPTLSKMAEKRFESKPSHVSEKIQPSKMANTVAVSSLGRDMRDKEDPIDREFLQIMETNMPMIWVFGYTQASIIRNKTVCMDTIILKNNLALINLSNNVAMWLGLSVDPSQVNGTAAKNSVSIMRSQVGSRTNDIHRRINERAEEILKDFSSKPNSRNTLSIEDICELLKLSLVAAVHPKQGPTPEGFVIDNFPLSAQEAMEAESLLYKCMACLYFSSIMWSKSKDREPVILKPQFHLRETQYSEKEAEDGADYFGFKTIKIINAEDLEEVQVADINTLVRQHLEGHGLTLHKVMRKVPADGEAGSQAGHDYLPDGTRRRAMGEKSNIILDHRDFVKDQSKAPSSRQGSNVGSRKEGRYSTSGDSSRGGKPRGSIIDDKDKTSKSRSLGKEESKQMSDKPPSEWSESLSYSATESVSKHSGPPRAKGKGG